MKLISSYKDYYDYLARDRNISDQLYLWDRKPHIKFVNFAIPNIIDTGSPIMVRKGVEWHRDWEAFGFVIWFCGVPVPVVKIVRTDKSFHKTTECVYCFENLPDEVRGKFQKRKWGRNYKSIYDRWHDLFCLSNAHDYESGWSNTQCEMVSDNGRQAKKVSVEEMHRIIGSPVFCHPLIIEEYKEMEEKEIK